LFGIIAPMPAISPPADFRADSAVEARGGGHYLAQVTEAWSGPPGPNGGYIAALVLRAIRAEVADEARRPRSLSLHYLRPPASGPAEIAVIVERSGRGATTCSARLAQGGKLRTLALCTLAIDYESAADWSSPPPPVPRPEEVEPLDSRPMVPEIFHQHEFRPTFGDPPFTGSDSTIVGGWVRTRKPTRLDPELIALYSDVFWPASFPRLSGPALAPTIDLSIHFRADPPAGEHEFVLGRFSSTTSAGGFFEEDGELWSVEGTLLAQSRQLALIRPIPQAAG
jgi:acyl-CoA thioesterase